jgi:hypothetical protein
MARHWLTALGGILTVLPALIAAAIPGGILFLILAPVPLFLVGLGQGVRACWIAGMIALIVAGLVGGLPWMTTALVLLVAPVCVLVQQALRSRPGQDGTAEWYPPGLLVIWLTVLGVIWLALMIGLLAAEHGGLGAQDALVEELKPHLGQMLPDAEEAQIDQVLAIAINWAQLAGLAGLGADRGPVAGRIRLRRAGIPGAEPGFGPYGSLLLRRVGGRARVLPAFRRRRLYSGGFLCRPVRVGGGPALGAGHLRYD